MFYNISFKTYESGAHIKGEDAL